LNTASKMKPTVKQREYLLFIKSFTDRWGIPPSFEEIARHFGTSSPSVNGMVKTLEAKGFIARIPGAARTLRVTLPSEILADTSVGSRKAGGNTEVVVRTVGALIERLVPRLKGDRALLNATLDDVGKALEVTLRGEGASEEQLAKAYDSLRRVVSVALGDSTETSPGRRLPWWRKPR
jgi:SOS-response transcriptional repressor LexA